MKKSVSSFLIKWRVTVVIVPVVNIESKKEKERNSFLRQGIVKISKMITSKQKQLSFLDY